MVFGAEVGGVSFNPSKDIPSLTGKVILVTGGNTGLGKASILELSRHNPAEIWLAGRNTSRVEAAIAEIKSAIPDANIKPLELDLSSFASIKSAAQKVTSESTRLDILMLNAGVLGVPPGLTTDGYEIQFGTNHVGHFLLTKLLLPLLQTTAKLPAADVRVVVLTSNGEHYGPKQGIDYSVLKTTATSYGSLTRYGQSKLANALFARQLAKQHPELTVAAIHPGGINTELFRGVGGTSGVVAWAREWVVGTLFTPVEKGAHGQLWAATSAKRIGKVEEQKKGEFGVVSGEVYWPVGVAGKASAHAKSDEEAKRLWEWTEEEVKGVSL